MARVQPSTRALVRELPALAEQQLARLGGLAGLAAQAGPAGLAGGHAREGGALGPLGHVGHVGHAGNVGHVGPLGQAAPFAGHGGQAGPPGRSGHGTAGVLHGVPFLVKDSVLDVPGVPTGYGSRALANLSERFPAAEPAAALRRLLTAGLVVFGKTNLPELGLKGVSDSRAFGRVANPWDPSRTAGGSSGGSAAAVAAGVVPMAGGNDGGGSLRIPAACCGLFALKPSRGRVSNGPGFGEVWFGACSEGVVSRSVRDSALALDILAGPEPGDPFVAAAPPVLPFAQLALRTPPPLRIAFSVTSPIGTEVHPEARAAVLAAARLLQGLGHEVEEAAPAIDGRALARSFTQIYFGQVLATVRQAVALGARREEFEPLTLLTAEIGRGVDAGALTAELLAWNGYARALAVFQQRYDMLLTPTLAAPPLPHGTGDATPLAEAVLGLLAKSGLVRWLGRLGLLEGTIEKLTQANMAPVPFTQLANLTGVPAMSLPLHWTADGLPLGVQCVGRMGEEALLLQLAAQVEQAAPWFDRLSPLARGGD
ncbi:MAG: amidase [Burkholderiales bacterium]|nr:amidase [Burkholderiales bacterium]